MFVLFNEQSSRVKQLFKKNNVKICYSFSRNNTDSIALYIC